MMIQNEEDRSTRRRIDELMAELLVGVIIWAVFLTFVFKVMVGATLGSFFKTIYLKP